MAFVVELAKPCTVTGNTLPALTGGLSGKDIVGIDQGKFRIKVDRALIRSQTQVIEVTGDGDDEPAFESNLMVASIIRMSGYMLASQAIGLSNLADEDNNGTWATKILLSSDLKFSGFCLCEGVDIDYRMKVGNVIAVATTLYVTNTAVDELEGTLTTQV